jgi:hypothetical protein
MVNISISRKYSSLLHSYRIKMKKLFSKSKFDALVEEDFSFNSNKQFDDGRGNNFDPSWKDRVLNAEVPESEIGFKVHGDWAVVGYDKKPTNVNCGQFKWFLVCLRLLLHNFKTLDGHDYRVKGYGKRVWWHCNRPSCPVCFRKGWAVRLASKMEHRLKDCAKKHGKIEHIVLSPPKSDWGLTFPELCRKAVKVAKARGIIGGSMVFHFFRYHKANETYVGEKAHFYMSPHFHLLAFIKPSYAQCRHCLKAKNAGYVGRGVCEGCSGFEAVVRRKREKDGWICKVKGERKTIGGSAWYSLEHASVVRDVKNFRVARWFGVASYRKHKLAGDDIPRQDVCGICGKPLYRGRYHGNVKELLASLDAKGIRRSEGFTFDVKDADGNLMWSAVHDNG